MSSPPETTKKRKADDYQGGGDCESNAATDKGGTTLAAILAEMKDMKSEMNDMKGRLSRMDELENEVNDMKSRLSHLDELEAKCQAQGQKIIALEARCGCLERSTQILRKENKWKYSAPSSPRAIGLNKVLMKNMLKVWNIFWSNWRIAPSN